MGITGLTSTVQRKQNVKILYGQCWVSFEGEGASFGDVSLLFLPLYCQNVRLGPFIMNASVQRESPLRESLLWDAAVRRVASDKMKHNLKYKKMFIEISK